MSLAVCNGALCKCSFGVAPCSLVVTSVTKILGSNMPVATIMDNKTSNLPTFGVCSSMMNPTVQAATAAALGVLTPQPCSPMIASPWTPGCSKVIYSGSPALTNTSKCFCTYGGVIEIIYPNQQKIQLP